MYEARSTADGCVDQTRIGSDFKSEHPGYVSLRGPLARLRTPLDVPLALFLLSALVGLWVAYDRRLSRSMLIAIVVSIVLYYLIIYASRSGMRVWTLALCGLLVSLALAIYFVAQSGHLGYPPKVRPVSYLIDLSRMFPRFTPFHPHRNSVAVFLEGWLPLAAAMTLSAERRKISLLMGACTAVLALAILLSASRGAWLALALCLGLWWSTRSRRNLAVTGACGMTLILVLAGYTLSAPELSLESIPVINRLTPLLTRPDRLAVYRGSWYLIQDFPFTGIGLGGTFAMVYSRYVLMIQVPFLTYSHNLFLQVWLSHGLVGILAFGWLIVAFFLFVWKAGRKGKASFQGAWLGVAAILMHGLTDARQYADGWTLLSPFALLGLAVAARGQSREGRTTGMLRTRKIRGIAAVGILATLLIFAGRPLTAMAYANAGALSQARGELAEGLTDERKSALLKRAAGHYQQAIALDQDNRTSHQRLGMLALEARRFEEAVTHLEAAYQADPANTTTHKALGLGYTWAGRLHLAQQLLAAFPDIVEELNVWGWWWGTQEEHEWGANAYRVSLLLNPDQPAVREALAVVPAD